MGNTTELERDDLKTNDEAELSDKEKGNKGESQKGESKKESKAEGQQAFEHMTTEGGTLVLNKGENRVVDRLRRAKAVASLAAPELEPTLDDLVEIAELIEDEGG
ncbi:MAG: hypothetical protein V4850_17515 [Myxococcota bacterium]